MEGGGASVAIAALKRSILSWWTGQQLKTEVIVDREAFERGAFKAQGRGFERLNKTFEGRLEEILSQIASTVWEEAS